MRLILPSVTRDVWALVGVQMITSAGFSLALPFLSLYLARERGLSMSLVGTLMFFAAFASALGQFLGGELSDRWGRKRVLLVSLAIRILAFLTTAWLMASVGSILAIASLYLVIRVSGGLAQSPVSALLADYRRARRVEGYGLLRVGANVGWALGPALGGYLATFLPYAALFVFGAGLTLLALVLAVWAVRDHLARVVQEGKTAVSAFRDRTLWIFLGLSLPVFLVAGQLVSTLSVFLVDRLGLRESQFGGLLTLNGLLVVLAQYPLARVMQTWPARQGLALGALLYALGYWSFGWIRYYPLMLLAIGVVTLGEMIFTPVAMALAAGLASEDQRGRYLGMFGLVQSFGWSGGAFLGGVLLDFAPSAEVLWGSLSSLGFLAALLFLGAGKLLHSPFQEKPAGALDQKEGRA